MTKESSRVVSKYFDLFDEQLTEHGKTRIGPDFSLRDCYANGGGVFPDTILFKHQRIGLYAFGTFGGKVVGWSMDFLFPEEEGWSPYDVVYLSMEFDRKYGSHG